MLHGTPNQQAKRNRPLEEKENTNLTIRTKMFESYTENPVLINK